MNIYINIFIFSILMLISTLVYHFINHKFGYSKYVVLKMVTSLIFVLSGVFALFIKGYICFDKVNPYNLEQNLIFFGWFVFIGGILGFIGDFLLSLCEKHGEKMFIIGLFSFLLNHIFFIIALFFINPFSYLDIILTALLIVICLALKSLFKLKIDKKYVAPCLCYLCVIALMVTKSVSAIYSGRNLEIRDIVFFLGAILFAGSDVVLVLNKFSPKYRKWLDCVNTFTYFPAQLIISFTIML